MTLDEILQLLARGDVAAALKGAEQTGASVLVDSVRKAIVHLEDPETYRRYYRTSFEGVHRRNPGAQIRNDGFHLDGRQTAAMEMIGVLSVSDLLDIGCADGSFIFNCLHHGVVDRAVGVDVWEEGIQWASKYGASSFPGRCQFVQDLFEDYAVRSKSTRQFGAVHLGEILEHVIDPVRVLLAAKDFLTADGGIVVTVPLDIPPLTEDDKEALENAKILQHVRHIDKQRLESLAAETGLQVVAQRTDGLGWVHLIATLKVV